MLQPRSSIIKTEIVEVKKEIVEGKKEESDEPEVDIVINNVVCSFNVRCHLNLRDIALRGLNVEYRRENGVRKPTMYFELYY
jgi:TATA-box binding protein (TBP) (component of TFIID and TFIIIB)